MVTYYDRLLLLIGASIALGTATSLHGAVATYQGAAAGSLVATLLLFDALFRNPPVAGSGSERMASVAVGLSWLFTTLLYL